MKFKINLATRVYIDVRKLNICLVLMFSVLFIWLFITFYIFMDNTSQLKRLADHKARLAPKTGSDKVSEADYMKFLARVKYVNAILYKRSYDWLTLFSNLEQLVPEGVALRGLEPADKGESLKITATARNFPAIRRFVEGLEGSSKFTEINLVDQANIREANLLKGINFTITCKAQTL
jgi:hypothetical protein